MLHDDEGNEQLIDFDAPLRTRRKIIASFFSDNMAELSEEEIKLRSEIKDAIHFANYTLAQVKQRNKPVPRDHGPNLSVLIETAKYPDHHKILSSQAFLEEVERVYLIKRSDKLLLDLNITVYEVAFSDGSIIAEGKGFCDSSAKTSALGEAVERLTLDRPQLENLIYKEQAAIESEGINCPQVISGCYDLFHEDIPIYWAMGFDSNGNVSALPAELLYTNNQPLGPIKTFAIQHTSGSACGPNLEYAVYRSLLELIETDAYALHIRLGICDSIIPIQELCEEQDIKRIVDTLAQNNISVHAYHIQFDHIFPIVHSVLSNSGTKLPSLSHGLGTGKTVRSAFRKSLLEAIQVYSDLSKLANANLEKSLLPSTTVKEPEFYWIDPANKETILTGLSEYNFKHKDKKNINDSDGMLLKDLIALEEKNIGPISFYEITSVIPGQHVVRAYAELTASVHDLTKRPQMRIDNLKERTSILRETNLPILT